MPMLLLIFGLIRFASVINDTRVPIFKVPRLLLSTKKPKLFQGLEFDGMIRVSFEEKLVNYFVNDAKENIISLEKDCVTIFVSLRFVFKQLTKGNFLKNEFVGNLKQ